MPTRTAIWGPPAAAVDRWYRARTLRPFGSILGNQPILAKGHPASPALASRRTGCKDGPRLAAGAVFPCVAMMPGSAADPEDLVAADRAGALERRLAILHGDVLRVLD